MNLQHDVVIAGRYSQGGGAVSLSKDPEGGVRKKPAGTLRLPVFTPVPLMVLELRLMLTCRSGLFVW